jgi:hypothetical protein
VSEVSARTKGARRCTNPDCEYGGRWIVRGMTRLTTSGGVVPVIAVFCVYVADNCQGMGVANQPAGTAARRVDANSLYEIRLAVPAAMAPQRYEVITSLQ